MNGISMIFQKEMKRVFSDKKLIFSLFILPVIMVVAIYGLMIFIMQMVEDDQSAHIATVAVYHMPESLETFLPEDFYDSHEITYIQNRSELETAKEKVLNEELDLILDFDEDFDEKIRDYAVLGEVPDIHSFYNPSADYSYNAWNEMESLLQGDYRQLLLTERFGSPEATEIFSINKNNDAAVIQDDDKAGGKMLGSMIPYLVTILLFAGGMAIGIDMIAGEKERGTMASLLITPVRRTSIVMGKLFAMMLLSGLSALVYIVSMVAAIPLLLQSAIGEEAAGVGEEAASYGISLSFQAWQIWMLIFVVVSMVFVYVALVALTAVFAKDTKEANTYISPIYMVVMICGMITMFTGENAGTVSYCIPIYGAVVAMKNILGQDISLLNCLICVISHLLLGGILVAVVARAFDSEKVMFDA